MKTLNKEQYIEVINKQFEINGYDVKYEDVLDKNWKKKEKWFSFYTTTPEKEKEFKTWLEQYLIKNKIGTKRELKNAIAWFILDVGLKTVKE